MAIELEDGTIVRSLPEQVDYLTTHNEENEIAIDNLAARLEAAIAGVLHYKGSVATYADLPADAEIGDVYNVIDTGANYAWTGSEWDELGSSIDISSLVDLTSAQTITGRKTIKDTLAFESADGTYTATIYNNNNGSFYVDYGNTSVIAANAYRIATRTLHPFDVNEDLGGISNKWRNIYLSHAINPNSSNYGLTLPNTSSFTADSELLHNSENLLPAVTASYDLGSSDNKWKDIYASGLVNAGSVKVGDSMMVAGVGRGLSWESGALYLVSGYNGLKIGNGISNPIDVDGYIVNLRGRTTLSFRQGNDTVSFAELKELIDYAKAQGWIS